MFENVSIDPTPATSSRVECCQNLPPFPVRKGANASPRVGERLGEGLQNLLLEHTPPSGWGTLRLRLFQPVTEDASISLTLFHTFVIDTLNNACQRTHIISRIRGHNPHALCRTSCSANLFHRHADGFALCGDGNDAVIR